MFREIESCIRRPEEDIENCPCYSGVHGIESYGISVTTLEEVFLKVAGHGIDEKENNQHHIIHTTSDSLISETSQPNLINAQLQILLCGL